MLVAVIDNLGKKLSNKARQAHLDEKTNDLYMDLMTIEGLATREVNAAHIKMVAAPQLLSVFGRIPTEFKASWIRSLLSGYCVCMSFGHYVRCLFFCGTERKHVSR